MLLEIEVLGDENSPMDLNRMFDLLTEPRPVSRVYTADSDGRDGWCEVTGWAEEGPCQALAALSEDSGDGVVLLVYGGDRGIRLMPVGCPEDWDLASTNQWGEPCLMLGKDAPVE